MKTEYNKIIGGYSVTPWGGKDEYKADPELKCFLYSLSNGKKYPHERYKGHGIYNGSSYGPTFGGGFDLYISNECN